MAGETVRVGDVELLLLDAIASVGVNVKDGSVPAPREETSRLPSGIGSTSKNHPLPPIRSSFVHSRSPRGLRETSRAGSGFVVINRESHHRQIVISVLNLLLCGLASHTLHPSSMTSETPHLGVCPDCGHSIYPKTR